MTTPLGAGNAPAANPDPGLVVIDAAGEPAALELRVGSLTDRAAGRVGILLRPAMRRRTALALDLLAAVGVRADTSLPGRDEDALWQLVHVWYAAHDIHEIVIAGIDDLPDHLLHELLLLTAAVPATIWLVITGPPTDRTCAVIDGWLPNTPQPWTALADHLARTATGPAVAAPTPATSAFPRHLPDDDFPTFRTACRATLSRTGFAAVDERLHREAASIAQWLSTIDAPSVPALQAYLHERYRATATTAELLVTTRAAQIALFRHGWHLQVDHAGLLATATDCPRPAARTGEHWAWLSVYPFPHRAAACALAAADLDMHEMTALTLGSVEPSGATVTVAGRSVPIEPGARLYLRAQRLWRIGNGAQTDSPLLATQRNKPLSPRAAADQISAAREETGLALTSRRVARTRPAADRWATAWGLSLQPLTDGARG